MLMFRAKSTSQKRDPAKGCSFVPGCGVRKETVGHEPKEECRTGIDMAPCTLGCQTRNCSAGLSFKWNYMFGYLCVEF
jgi:hypothetical protein